MFTEVNLTAVVIAALVNMALGFLWYGPLFGNAWMKLSGVTQAKIEESKKKGMQLSYLATMVSSLVLAYVTSIFIGFTAATSALEGALVGALLWFGYIATSMLGIVLWDGKSWNLYFLNSGYYLVSLTLMGALLAVWV